MVHLPRALREALIDIRAGKKDIGQVDDLPKRHQPALIVVAGSA
tara:strand:- start:542 stop:673 length:132 start_codon:yes stop_codon:yes gene_type:complete